LKWSLLRQQEEEEEQQQQQQQQDELSEKFLIKKPDIFTAM